MVNEAPWERLKMVDIENLQKIMWAEKCTQKIEMKHSKALHRQDFLDLLARSKNSKRRRLLAQWAEKNDLMAVSEIIGNILKGNVKLTPQQLNKLRSHKNRWEY